jgi:hypothetical protein
VLPHDVLAAMADGRVFAAWSLRVLSSVALADGGNLETLPQIVRRRPRAGLEALSVESLAAVENPWWRIDRRKLPRLNGEVGGLIPLAGVEEAIVAEGHVVERRTGDRDRTPAVESNVDRGEPDALTTQLRERHDDLLEDQVVERGSSEPMNRAVFREE